MTPERLKGLRDKDYPSTKDLHEALDEIERVFDERDRLREMVGLLMDSFKVLTRDSSPDVRKFAASALAAMKAIEGER